jgi:cystathionine beta-synthase
VEATAGNTGLALALVAAQKGYTLSVVVPDKMSDEKISHLRAMGAEVVMTRSDVAKGHPEYYQDVAARLAAARPNTLYINQFANAANAAAHEHTTGPEIWEQMGGKVDAFVAAPSAAWATTCAPRTRRWRSSWPTRWDRSSRRSSTRARMLSREAGWWKESARTSSRPSATSSS